MISKFFDTGFACYGTLQNYVDSIIISPSITFFCIFYVRFLSYRMSLKYLKGLHPPICDHQIKQIFKNHTYSWLGKNLDIVASFIVSTYDIDKRQNGILKMPLFHTPASHFSLNVHDTMGDINEQAMEMTDSFRIFVGSFVPIPRLIF